MRRSKKSATKRKRTDREKVELFVTKVNELNNTRLMKNGFNIRRRVSGEIGQPVVHELEQPNEADLRDYLITFRHFISEDEDVFIERIFSICYQRLTSDQIKQYLIQLRQVLGQVKQHGWMQLTMNGEVLTPLNVTDMYLNGKYFHNDIEHQQTLDNLPPLIADELRFQFLNFVINTSKITFLVRNAINEAFNESLFDFDK